MTDNGNPYLPHPARILRIREENSQIKSFELAFTDPERHRAFSYRPGQFVMVSVPHGGEAPISISSSPTRPGRLTLSVRKAGRLTAALHRMAEGELLGLRGPYGRPFPVDELKGRDLIFVAGGIGLAPLASVVNLCLDRREEYGQLTVLYGSRSPADIAFRAELEGWRRAGVKCLLTVDQGGEGWTGQVGLVTTLFAQISPDPGRSSALICGPPVMFRFVAAELTRLGLSDQDIVTTLERHMKCGLGVCRHCHLGPKLVCAHGPVFTLAELRGLREAELA